MDYFSIAICRVCDKLMVDPRILPCAHSFCLGCLVSSTCPTCQTDFQIPRGGMKDLKENLFIARLKTALQNYPTISYTEASLSRSKSALNKYPFCEAHSEMLTLICEDCNALVCGHCLTLNHKNHNIKHVSEYFDSVKNKLEQILKKKEERVNVILRNCKDSEDKMCNNESIACGLKEQIKQRGLVLKTVIDSVVDDLIKNVDISWGEYVGEAGNVVTELKNMKSILQAEIKSLKQQITDVNCFNFIEASSNVVDKEVFIPCHSEDFAVYFHIDDKCDKDFKNGIGALEIVPKMKLVKEVKLGRNVHSFAEHSDKIFVCYKNSTKVDAFSYNDSARKSSCDFENVLNIVHDMLVFKTNLLVVGGSDQRNGCKVNKVLKVGLLLKGMPSEMYEFPCRGYLPRLSTTLQGNVLCVSNDNLVHLSENGDVVKKVDLAFNITNALQSDHQQYVVCRLFGDICIVDDFGEVLVKYSPSKEFRKIKSPTCLAMDRRGYVYASGNSWPVTNENKNKKKVCVLNKSLHFVWSCEMKGFLNKIYFSETNDKLLTLLTVDGASNLLVFDV